MKKITTLFLFILFCNASFAGKLYWKQVVSNQIINPMGPYPLYTNTALTTQWFGSIPSLSDTIYFNLNSFPSGQPDTIVVPSYLGIAKLDFSAISTLANRPLLLIPSTSTLTIHQTPSLLNIKLAIEGTLNITCDNSGTYGMSFTNLDAFSDLGTGQIIFDFGFNGGSTNLNLTSDLILNNISLVFNGGNVNSNGKNITCKNFNAENTGSNIRTITIAQNTTLEVQGAFLINNPSYTTFTTQAQTTLVLNSRGGDPLTTPAGDPYHFQCSGCDFSNTDIIVKDSSKYAFNLDESNAGILTCKTFFLGRKSYIGFGQDDTLAFNTISTNSKSDADYTFISGGSNTPPNRSFLKDLNGGNNCLYNVKPQQLTFLGGNASLFVVDNSANNISVPNIGFTFADPSGAVTTTTNNLTVDGCKIKLYELNTNSTTKQTTLVDSVLTDANGIYKLNPNYFNGSSFVICAIPNAASHPNLIPCYYMQMNGTDSAAFDWESAHIYAGLTCGSTIISTVHILEKLAPTGSGQITGRITEGSCFGCRTMSTLIPGNGVKSVKVGLGKNPPGAVVAFTTTDANGDYSFDGLPIGDYTVYADIAGLDLTGTHTVIIANGSTVTAQNFIADSATVDPVGLVTFIKTQVAELATDFQVYPNPFNSTIHLNFGEFTVTTNVSIELIDVLGKIVYTSNETLTPNKTAIKSIYINKVNLQSGLYILKTQYNNNVYINRLVKE